MIKRIAAIVFIYLCTAVAWFILAGTILMRTNDTSGRLAGKVASSWGSPQEQAAPSAFYEQVADEKTKTTSLPLDASRISTAIDLEYRQKGLLWYSTYKVAFGGDFTFRNTSDHPQQVTFALNFPATQAVYDDLQFAVNGRPVTTTSSKSGVQSTTAMAAGETAILHVAYRSQGLSTWKYNFGGDVSQVRDFSMEMKTNFTAIDFPDNSLSPTEKRQNGDGWELHWTYRNLVTGYQIAMVMPEHVQPGPLAGEISLFAPVSLLFYFFLMWTITTIRKIELHPMNYLFLAMAFFAFHLLMAYLVDHISVHAAFIICSAISIGLVVSYLRLVVGLRFAAVEAGGAQFVYLVLFSYAFFFRGFTGLAVTVGAILSLFAAMQWTGRIKWSEIF